MSVVAELVLETLTDRGQTCHVIRREHVLEVLGQLKAEGYDYLADLCGLDLLRWPDGPGERYAVAYQLYSFQNNEFIRVKALIPEEDNRIDSATLLWPAANWLEREVYDLFGTRFLGHPDLRRILMPDDFGSFPLRKDYPLQGLGERDAFPRVEPVDEEDYAGQQQAFDPEELDDRGIPEELQAKLTPGLASVEAIDDENMVLNYGPQHPATHGTLRNVMELQGERIERVHPEIGFLHTGFEKLGEDMTYNQFITVTDRMNYMSALSNNIGFAHAVEEMLGVEIPRRAQVLRVILGELTRIADHAVSLGLSAMDVGAFTAMLWSFREREKIYDILENVCGARLTTAWTRIGGVIRDTPPDFPDQVRAFLRTFPPVLRDIEKLLLKNKIFKERLIGVGLLSSEDALAYGVTGPLLRASGVDHDIRKKRPYYIYPELDWDVPTQSEGDSYARFLQRLAEVRESLRIIEQALGKLEPGSVMHPDYKLTSPKKDDVYTDMESLIHHFKVFMYNHGIRPAKGEIYSCTEAPNGELGWYILSDGSEIPYRVRIHPPSFVNYQVFPKLAEGGLISDSVAILSTLNVIAGELDR